MNSFIVKSSMILAVVFVGSGARAETPARYFRIWEGFKRPDLSAQSFVRELPSFMADTVRLYGGRGLSNYIVVMPPASKPAFVPDELALVAITAESDYRKIRETPEGQAYSARHWDVFDRATSRSAPQFIDYQRTRPSALAEGVAYDVVGEPLDWSTGFTLVYIGVRKEGLAPAEFLKHLRGHIELTRAQMVPRGLRGYIVTAHENYEVAYLNWSSKDAHDRAMASPGSRAVFADAQEIMNALMYQEAVQIVAGSPVEDGCVYSTVQQPK